MFVKRKINSVKFLEYLSRGKKTALFSWIVSKEENTRFYFPGYLSRGKKTVLSSSLHYFKENRRF
ncbi:hypothetical protein CGL51_14610 [Pyrobaculum aerophilum]|uniref:Uncharacterized protein n=1 Tax=Pyrobaculum aerophilum TaxID=13773 RepID=A0A371QTZ3_9CREN|nr:hypothetical protein CGL51_14610 [Pyrobaculum aerophilum]RFA96204.1 hypothetical protein CGL52_11290 [Pyrobaculum aerophilum]